MLHSATLLRLLALCAAFVTHMTKAQVVCPWDDQALENWSNPNTWPSGAVPTANAVVVIPADKKVLLDAPIPRLQTLTIEGVLVWGDVEGLRLETSYILIKGEFHMGSEECPLTKNADIFLWGKSDSAPVYAKPYGTKFIGADAGSKLEMHGKEKQSWTKLTQTVGPEDDSCGYIYDSSKESFGREYQEGLQVVIWNPDGTVFDYGIVPTQTGKQEDINKFAYKIGNMTAVGKIVAVAVREDIGSPGTSWEPLYQAVEQLGGSDIRNIAAYEPYALVAVSGHPNTARETRITRNTEEGILTATAAYDLESRNLVFSAESATTKNSSTYYTRFRVSTKKLSYPLVTVLDDVSSWQTGDQVVVASTDFDWKQAEVRTIVECIECSNYQFRVDRPFVYEHFGEVTYRVDARAEVGLLSRNIRIEAEVQPECYANDDLETFLCNRFGRDTFGGHVISTLGSFTRIEGVQLYHMGQQKDLGRYPLHFHMMDEAPGQYFKSNVIYDSFSRCLTIHGTDNVTVNDNVCFNHLGHGVFLEDSAERWNHIHRNLVIGTMHGYLILSDRIDDDCDGHDYCNLLSSFWITRPEVYMTGNVAAGSDGHGFVFSFADVPLRLSYDRQLERGYFGNMTAQYTKVEQFDENVAHSNGDTGLWFDSRVSAGQYHNGKYVPVDGIMFTNGLYDPRVGGTPDGEHTESVFSGLTLYKNDDFDAWVRCGNLVITNSTFADSKISYSASFTTGKTSCSIKNSIFIGETDNKGLGFTYYNKSSVYDGLPQSEKPQHTFDRSLPDKQPDALQTGLMMYQGPMFVDNVYFDRYYNYYYNDSFIENFGFRPFRPSSALGFHRKNEYALIPRSGVKNLKFGYCDGVDNAWRLLNGNESFAYWEMRDGSVLATFHDYDGSLTGTPRSQVVQTRPYYLGPDCVEHPEWDMSVCSAKYTQLTIGGTGGPLDEPMRSQYPIIFSRDDARDDYVDISGTTGLKYIARVNKSYTMRFNTAETVFAPTKVTVKAQYGLEAFDIVRIAICFPKSTQNFKIRSVNPFLNNEHQPVWVDNLVELDADRTMQAYFWDSTKGYLYFKMTSNETFSYLNQIYPGDAPREVTIERLDGEDLAEDCVNDNPPYVNLLAPELPTVQPLTCSGPASPEGLGAPIRENHVYHSHPAESCADCPLPDVVTPFRESERRGCFWQEFYLKDFPENEVDHVELRRAMTPEFCISRCFQRGFPYAGLYSGSKCQCANSVGRNGVVPEDTHCFKACTGNSSQSCGGGWEEVYFYTTGAAITEEPARCGPQNRGVVFGDTCLYVNYVMEGFWSAEERCGLMGGQLATIKSEEKQDAIALYLRDVETDVWFGGKGSANNWHHLDESVMTWFNWRTTPIPTEENRFLFLQEYRRYKWNKSPSYRLKMSLCDLPVENTYKPSGDCGYQMRGTTAGAYGRCFYRLPTTLTYRDSFYECRRMFGRMASVLDVAEKVDIEMYLNSNDDGERYWVYGDPSQEGYQKAYDEVVERSLIELDETRLFRGLCLLDSHDTLGCPEGWINSGSSCYFKTEQNATTYFEAAGYCDGDSTALITVDSQEESDFLGTILGGTVWTDVRYDGRIDQHVTSGGQVAPSIFWPATAPSPLTTLSDGLCVLLNTATMTFAHYPCRASSTAFDVVCEAPLTYFDGTKASQCLSKK